jgi:hypothetical protein
LPRNEEHRWPQVLGSDFAHGALINLALKVSTDPLSVLRPDY